VNTGNVSNSDALSQDKEDISAGLDTDAAAFSGGARAIGKARKLA
jgi:hypothetical protein